MAIRVSELREARTSKTRKSFRIRDFRGVNEDYVGKLEAIGIRAVEQMRQHGATQTQRVELAKKTGVPEESILEFVKLSDLARLPGVKAIRARLYHDAGIDTLEKMARWDPEAMRLMLIEFVEKTGFDGIAPLPKEAANAVKVAGELPKIIEY
jgi:restriction endonuclease Mrr